MLGQKSDGTANVRARFLHVRNAFGEFFNFFVCEAHARKPDAMPRQVKFINKIIVAVELVVRNAFVFFNGRLGIARLGAIGAILSAVAATDIRQKLNVDTVAFVFRA